MFTVKIYTPEKFFLETQAESLTCCGLDGEICILSNHMAMVLAVKSGIMRVKTADGLLRLETGSGYIEVNRNVAEVFVSSCYYEEEANAAREQAKLREDENLESITHHTHRTIQLERRVAEFGKVKKNI